ncbi:MAG TPA: ATP-binding protein [Candidatus Dormibacteraeota bacterium]|nr:ATP-binding protein [Candidatus Dormibacteraeota bacterium]
METARTAPPIADWLKRYFQVLWEPRSYLTALYMVTALPLGLLYFVVLIVGSLLGAFMTFVLVGVLILLGVLVAAWLFAILERELAILLLGVNVPPLALPDQEILTPWTMLVRHLQRATTWRSLAYLLVKLPFGLFATLFAFGLLTPCLAGMFIPIGDVVSGGPRPSAVAALIVPGIPAVVGLALVFHILNAIGRAWGRFAGDMLGVTPEQHQLWEARRRAELADRSRRELIMNVSHELRTPVATIQAHLDSLLLPDAARPSDEDLERRLTVTAAETRRLADLIEDLLMLARADSHELRVANRPVELAPLIRQVIQSMAPLALQQRKVTLDEAAVAEGLSAIADPDRLAQVLSNLVRNAINYTPEGGVVSIRVAGVNSDHLQIAVSDTGIGISADDLNHIFERFYRADGSRTRATGGFGLGLAIGRELVEAMGGSLAATSEPGLGSTFTITLRSVAAR